MKTILKLSHPVLKILKCLLCDTDDIGDEFHYILQC